MWVSAVSGVPLFDASSKYNSGTGWPSFFQPIDPVGGRSEGGGMTALPAVQLVGEAEVGVFVHEVCVWACVRLLVSSVPL